MPTIVNSTKSPESRPNLIRASISDKYSGLMRISAHLDHMSHCKITSGTHRSNRWTYPVFIICNAIKSRVVWSACTGQETGWGDCALVAGSVNPPASTLTHTPHHLIHTPHHTRRRFAPATCIRESTKSVEGYIAHNRR